MLPSALKIEGKPCSNAWADVLTSRLLVTSAIESRPYGASIIVLISPNRDRDRIVMLTATTEAMGLVQVRSLL